MSLLLRLRSTPSGTTYTQTLSASTTPDATFSRSIASILLVSSLVGAVFIRDITKVLSDTTTLSSTFTNLIGKLLDTSTTLTSEILNNLAFLLDLLVSTTPTSTFINLISKTITDTSSLTSDSIKAISKTINVTTSLTGSINIAFNMLLDMFASTEVVGTFTRLINKTLTDTVSLTGEVFASLIYMISLITSASLISESSKIINKAISNTTTISASFVKFISKTISDTSNLVGDINKGFSITINGTAISTAEVLVELYQNFIVVLMSTSTNVSTSLSKRISTLFTSETIVGGNTHRKIFKSFAHSISLSIESSKFISKTIHILNYPRPKIRKFITKTISVSRTFTANVATIQSYLRTFVTSTNVSATTIRKIKSSISASLTLSTVSYKAISTTIKAQTIGYGRTLKRIGKTISKSLTPIASVRKTINVLLGVPASVVLSADLHKKIKSTLSASTSATLASIRDIRKNVFVNQYTDLDLKKYISKNISSTIIVTSRLLKSIRRTLTAPVALVSTFNIRATFRLLIDSLSTLSASFTWTRSYSVIMSATTNITLATQKLISKTLVITSVITPILKSNALADTIKFLFDKALDFIVSFDAVLLFNIGLDKDTTDFHTEFDELND